MLTDEQINRDLEMWFEAHNINAQKEEEERSGLWTFVGVVCVIVSGATFWACVIRLVMITRGH